MLDAGAASAAADDDVDGVVSMDKNKKHGLSIELQTELDSGCVSDVMALFFLLFVVFTATQQQKLFYESTIVNALECRSQTHTITFTRTASEETHTVRFMKWPVCFVLSFSCVYVF